LHRDDVASRQLRRLGRSLGLCAVEITEVQPPPFAAKVINES
jgi:hypothetical protein